MVIPSRSPTITWLNAIHIPPKRSHIIFIIVFRQPFELGLFSIFLPKGHRATNESLKTCRPKGIPIMVMQRINPPTRYSKNINIPPNRSQIILPRIFIEQRYKFYCKMRAKYYVRVIWIIIKNLYLHKE